MSVKIPLTFICFSERIKDIKICQNMSKYNKIYNDNMLKQEEIIEKQDERIIIIIIMTIIYFTK